MEDAEFDQALIAGAMDVVAQSGWRRLSVVAAARAAGLPLARARARFACRFDILRRFGRLADQAALTGIVEDGPVRDRLLGMVMSRIDALQAHRAGVTALLRDMVQDPLSGVALLGQTASSMRWLLDAAGVDTAGPIGTLRVKAMLGVWLYTLNAWRQDETEDLSPTMAALDRALQRAEQAENSLGGA